MIAIKRKGKRKENKNNGREEGSEERTGGTILENAWVLHR